MNIDDLYEQRGSFYLNPSQLARGGLYLCIVLGLVAFIAGMAIGEGPRTWASLLFNVFLFFGLALGGVVFAGIQDVIGAVWSRPIMRIYESFASFLPVATGLIVIFFVCIHFRIGGAEQVYSWINQPEILEPFWGKKTWLQPVPMYLRNIAMLLIVVFLARWQLRLKLRRDVAMAEGRRDEAISLGIHAQERLRHWSAPVLVVYAICLTFLAFDLTMSLAPTWFSTLWGGWSFAVMMQTLMATLLIVMFVLKSTPIGQVMRRQQFHDVGKLLHGFTIFWAYLTYAHVLTYWYGNVPEETEYFIHRLHGPWLVIVIVAPLLCFVLPLFALIPKASKWTKGIAIPLCAIILFAQWLVALLVVMPQVVAADQWVFPWIEAGCFIGILGLFMATWFRFGKKYPMVAIGDPLLPAAYAEH